MKVIKEDLGAGTVMYNYVQNCDHCKFLTIINNKDHCGKWLDLIKKSSDLSEYKQYDSVYGKKMIAIPYFCQLEDYKSSTSIPITNPFEPPKPEFEVCSYCGTEDKTVDRYKNQGMCKSCFIIHENDQIALQEAKMTNFKLKRINKTKRSIYF